MIPTASIHSRWQTRGYLAAGGPVSSLPPGSHLASEIEAILAAMDGQDGILVLESGQHRLDRTVRIVGLSRVTVWLAEGAILSPDFLGAGLDVATNALFALLPAELGGLTTLAQTSREGAASTILTSASGWVAGDYYVVSGANAALGSEAPLESDSASVVQTELGRVISLVGTTATIARSLQWHAMGAAIRRVRPCRDVAVCGPGMLDALGGTLAVGVYVESAHRSYVGGLGGGGFGRAFVDRELGARNCRVEKLFGVGQVNSSCLSVSSHMLEASDLATDPLAIDRFHPNASAVPRAQIHERFTSMGNRYDDCRFGRICGGVQTWGSHDLHVQDVTIHDLDATQMRTRMTAVGEVDAGAIMGICLEVGTGRLTFAQFAQRIRISRLECSAVLTAHASDVPLFWHDHREGLLDGSSLANVDTTADMNHGLMIHDTFNSLVRNTTLRGAQRAIDLENNPTYTIVDGLVIIPTNGDPATLSKPCFLWNCQNAVAILFKNVIIEATWDYTIHEWGAGFSDVNAMAGIAIEDVAWGLPTGGPERYVGRLTMARHDAGGPFALGTIVEMDAASAAGILRVVAAAAPSTRNCPVLPGENAAVGHTWLQTGYPRVVVANLPVAPGDRVRANGATGFAMADNADASLWLTIGRSISSLPGGGDLIWLDEDN